MADMRLIVAGAGGRMGRTLGTRTAFRGPDPAVFRHERA